MADKPSYLQTAAGPTFARGDTAFVRDRSGKIKTVATADAARLLEEDPEFLPVSAEDVTARDVEIARSTLSEKAKTLGEAAYSSAVDVPLAPVRMGLRAGKALAEKQAGPVDPSKLPYFVANPDALSGRTSLEGAVELGERALEGGYDENRSTDRQEAYREAARERAQVNPGERIAGNIAGQLPWAALGPGAALERAGLGLAARSAARVATGAAEGALLGEAQATEDAYIEDKPLTAEKLMASMGWGALIGGTASFAIGGAGDLAGAARRRLTRAPADPDLAAAAAPTRSFADPTEQRLSDAAEAAGANPAARQMAAKEEAGRLVEEAKRADPSDWRGFSRTATPEAQYVHRDKVLDLAAAETGDDLTKVLDRARPIQDEIDNLALKRDKVAAHMAADGVDDTAALAKAQAEAAALKERLGQLRSQLSARQTEVAGEAIGPVVKGGTRAKPKASSADQALNHLEAVSREAERRLADATTAADGVIALDWMRREQAKVWRTARQSSQKTTGYEQRALLEPTVEFLQKEYQHTADLLMDAGFVGKTQAGAQSAVNRVRVGLINGDRFDLRPFLNQVGSEEGAAFGGQVFQGNKDSIRSMLAGITPDGGRLRTEQFERFLNTQEQFYNAVKQSYDLTPANQAGLDELLASTAKMRDTLNSARGAATQIAKVQARIDADRVAGGTLGKMVAGAAMGGAQSGPMGAVRGALRGALGGTENTLQLQQALAGVAETSESKLAGWLSGIVGKFAGTEGAGSSAINAAAKVVDSRLDSAMDRFFDRLAKPTKKAPRATVDTTGAAVGGASRDAAKRAAVPLAIRLFAPAGNLREAYDQRVEELQMANRELGAGVRDGVTASLGGLTQSAPALTQQLAAAASRGAVYLQQHLPAATRAPSVFQPNRRAEISDMALRSFARRWATVANPMTAVEDLQNGQLTFDQVDALRNVYPLLYNGLRMKTMQRLQQLDQSGVTVPYQDKLQLNLLLDLGGAGEATLTTDFALRVSGLTQAQKAAQQQRRAPSKPMKNLSASRMSDSQNIGATLRGAS